MRLSPYLTVVVISLSNTSLAQADAIMRRCGPGLGAAGACQPSPINR